MYLLLLLFFPLGNSSNSHHRSYFRVSQDEFSMQLQTSDFKIDHLRDLCLQNNGELLERCSQS